MKSREQLHTLTSKILRSLLELSLSANSSANREQDLTESIVPNAKCRNPVHVNGRRIGLKRVRITCL